MDGTESPAAGSPIVTLTRFRQPPTSRPSTSLASASASASVRGRIAIITLAVVLAACDGGATVNDGPSLETIEGVVGGAMKGYADCTWLQDDTGQRFDVLFPVGWTWSFDPLSIKDPTGREVLRAGDRARLTGSRGEIGQSPCESGPLFDVQRVELSG